MSPRRILWTLAALHVAVIIASNVLVQIPLELGPVLTTWGSFTFPVIFLATDLSVRLLGADVARRVVLRAMVPALVATYVVSVVFQQGTYEQPPNSDPGETTVPTSWAAGDWNADGQFSTADLIFAFQTGGYGREDDEQA